MSEKVETRGLRAGFWSRLRYSVGQGGLAWAVLALHHSDHGFVAGWWMMIGFFIGWGNGREWLRTNLRKISQR